MPATAGVTLIVSLFRQTLHHSETTRSNVRVRPKHVASPEPGQTTPGRQAGTTSFRHREITGGNSFVSKTESTSGWVFINQLLVGTATVNRRHAYNTCAHPYHAVRACEVTSVQSTGMRSPRTQTYRCDGSFSRRPSIRSFTPTFTSALPVQPCRAGPPSHATPRSRRAAKSRPPNSNGKGEGRREKGVQRRDPVGMGNQAVRGDTTKTETAGRRNNPTAPGKSLACLHTPTATAAGRTDESTRTIFLTSPTLSGVECDPVNAKNNPQKGDGSGGPFVCVLCLATYAYSR